MPMPRRNHHLATNLQALARQMFRGQRGSKIRIPLADPSQNLLLERSRQFCGSKDDRAAHEQPQQPHVP
jgi:hypothetical protein